MVCLNALENLLTPAPHPFFPYINKERTFYDIRAEWEVQSTHSVPLCSTILGKFTELKKQVNFGEVLETYHICSQYVAPAANICHSNQAASAPPRRERTPRLLLLKHAHKSISSKTFSKTENGCGSLEEKKKTTLLLTCYNLFFFFFLIRNKIRRVFNSKTVVYCMKYGCS